MAHPAFLTDIVIILLTTLVVGRLCLALGIPSIIGFILAGIAIGPSGWSFIGQEDVSEMAELGLVLLLFVIGLELSPQPLARIGNRLLAASAFQICATALSAALLLFIFTSMALAPVLIIGAGIALSSTAIVLKQLSDLGATDTLRGLVITGVLLIQDIFVIMLMLALPFLAIDTSVDWKEPALRSVLSLGGMVILVVVSRRVLPYILTYVVRPGGKEFVTLFAVLMAFGGASLAGYAGWSLPLGACVAGLLLAETNLRHQLASDILPFRDVFNALFFVSLGMLFDPMVAASNSGLLIGAILVTLVAKAVISGVGILVARWPLRLAMEVGLGLCTVSEFGYVLVNEADRLGLMPGDQLDVFIVYAIGTMVLGAMLIPASQPIAEWALRFSRSDMNSDGEAEDGESTLRDHVLIVGFGINGKNLVRVLKSTSIPHCVVELNPRLVRDAEEVDTKVIRGDASRAPVLAHAGLPYARALVVAINDPQATQRVIAQARALRPNLYILARTHFDADIDELYTLGVQRVISEDFETSIEISAQVLKEMDIPDNIVRGQIAALRAGRYGMLRSIPTDEKTIEELGQFLQITGTKTHYLMKDSPHCEKTIASINLRALSGVTIIAVVRNGKPTTNPSADFKLCAGDVLVLVGSHAQLDSAQEILEPTA